MISNCNRESNALSKKQSRKHWLQNFMIIPFRIIGLQKVEICIPFVSNHLRKKPTATMRICRRIGSHDCRFVLY